MKHSYLLAIIIASSITVTHCETTLNLSPQKAYIASALQEWDKTHLSSLNPYQLQLLTSNLNLLCEQAVHMVNAERLKQRILYSTRELIDTNTLSFFKTLPTDCNNYMQLMSYLNEAHNSLKTCTQHLESLDQSLIEPLLTALIALEQIGQKALTYQSEELAGHTKEVTTPLKMLLHEFATYTTDLEKIPTIDYQEHTNLAQFYALRNIIGRATNKAWKIIALNMVNSLAHSALLHTCATIFDASFEVAYARLSSQEVPEEYRTLLFVSDIQE